MWTPWEAGPSEPFFLVAMCRVLGGKDCTVEASSFRPHFTRTVTGSETEDSLQLGIEEGIAFPHTVSCIPSPGFGHGHTVPR